jgi:hypothetical protein
MRSFIRSRENWYRDVWLFLITLLVLLALYTLGGQTEEIQTGRAFGTEINCGFNQAVLLANRHLIEGSSSSRHETPTSERRLEELGFGTRVQREEQAKLQGVLYIQSVQAGIELFAGAKASGIIDDRPKENARTGKLDVANVGTVNCMRLKKITKAH